MKRLLKKLLRIPSPARVPPPARYALWSIGVFTGAPPLALGPSAGSRNPVITRDSVTDADVSFVADPFLHRANGIWHLFFEVLNRGTGRGEIALATSADLEHWAYDRIVLAEPFHLSYPFVFEWQGERYMIPEAFHTNSIRLYRADPFPHRWVHEHTLLSGAPYADTTLVRRGDLWWLFTLRFEGRHDNLRLHFAHDLFGEWTEHPASPIIAADPHTARPAGRFVEADGHLYRFAQDCAPAYGLAVRAFEITTLTPVAYAEQPMSGAPILSGSAEGWNADRMHHVDAHCIAPGQWVAAVDGAYNTTSGDIHGTSR